MGAVEPPWDIGATDRARSRTRDGPGPSATASDDGEAVRRPGPAAARARVLQRPRWLRRGRTGVRDGPRGGAADAGALDQRDRQSRLRLPGLRVGLGIHVVAQQPW